MTEAPPSPRYRVHRAVLAREIAGETVAVQLEAGEAYCLDAPATRAWRLLAAGAGSDEIVRVLGEEYEVASDRLELEVEELLAALARWGLVEPAG